MPTEASINENDDDAAVLERLATQASDFERARGDATADREQIRTWGIDAFADLGRIRSKAIDLRPTPPGAEPRTIERELLTRMAKAVRIERRVNELFAWAVNPTQKERARGWLYWVVNTLLEGIHGELDVVASGSVSFRFYSGRLEHVRPVRSYLSHPSAVHALRDFRRALGPATARLEEHDEAVDLVTACAVAMLDDLTRRPSFLAQVDECLALYATTHPSDPYPGGAFSKERFPSHVAERLVNNVRRGLQGHTDQDFWDEFGERLRAQRVGPSVEALDRARDDLLVRNFDMQSWLEMQSDVLCSIYDLSAAPLPGSSEP